MIRDVIERISSGNANVDANNAVCSFTTELNRRIWIQCWALGPLTKLDPVLGVRIWALGPLTKMDPVLGVRIWALGPLTKRNQMKLPAFVRHFRLLFSLLRLCLINHDKQSFFFSSFLLFFFCHRSQIKIRLPYPLAIASLLGPFVRSVNLEEIELVHLLFHCELDVAVLDIYFSEELATDLNERWSLSFDAKSKMLLWNRTSKLLLRMSS
ncbi:hypothetical protein SDJN03_16976, partial [Cucurbita argyrosperma subsp. sororia]